MLPSHKTIGWQIGALGVLALILFALSFVPSHYAGAQTTQPKVSVDTTANEQCVGDYDKTKPWNNGKRDPKTGKQGLLGKPCQNKDGKAGGKCQAEKRGEKTPIGAKQVKGNCVAEWKLNDEGKKVAIEPAKDSGGPSASGAPSGASGGGTPGAPQTKPVDSPYQTNPDPTQAQDGKTPAQSDAQEEKPKSIVDRIAEIAGISPAKAEPGNSAPGGPAFSETQTPEYRAYVAENGVPPENQAKLAEWAAQNPQAVPQTGFDQSGKTAGTGAGEPSSASQEPSASKSSWCSWSWCSAVGLGPAQTPELGEQKLTAGQQFLQDFEAYKRGEGPAPTLSKPELAGFDLRKYFGNPFGSPAEGANLGAQAVPTPDTGGPDSTGTRTPIPSNTDQTPTDLSSTRRPSSVPSQPSDVAQVVGGVSPSGGTIKEILEPRQVTSQGQQTIVPTQTAPTAPVANIPTIPNTVPGTSLPGPFAQAAPSVPTPTQSSAPRLPPVSLSGPVSPLRPTQQTPPISSLPPQTSAPYVPSPSRVAPSLPARPFGDAFSNILAFLRPSAPAPAASAGASPAPAPIPGLPLVYTTTTACPPGKPCANIPLLPLPQMIPTSSPQKTPPPPEPKLDASSGTYICFDVSSSLLIASGKKSSNCIKVASPPQSLPKPTISDIVTGLKASQKTIQPTATLIAKDSMVKKGERTTLTWGSVGTNSCIVYDGAGSPIASGGGDGSVLTPPIQTTTAFTLSCAASGGSTIGGKATVLVR